MEKSLTNIKKIILTLNFYVKFFEIFFESIVGMFISLSMLINTETTVIIVKSKSVDMLIYITHNTNYI